MISKCVEVQLYHVRTDVDSSVSDLSRQVGTVTGQIRGLRSDVLGRISQHRNSVREILLIGNSIRAHEDENLLHQQNRNVEGMLHVLRVDL